MKRSLLYLLAIIAMLFLLRPVASFSQETDFKIRAKKALAERWIGHWTSPAGYIYLADMRLDIDNEFNVKGTIKWVLVKSPRESELGKQGLSGAEHVSGKFETGSGILALQGHSKDDPNVILGLDRYRLILSENLRSLGGITYNHGNWQGSFMLIRE